MSLSALLLVMVLLPAFPPVTVSAQVQDGATMTVLRGQVAVIRPDGSAMQPAPSGTVISAGDEIRTLDRTGALITFFAGTEIEMGEETILVVDRVTKSGATVDISLKQVLGSTLNRVQSLTDPASSYRIDAGGAMAVVRGTTFLLIGPVATSQGNISALICLDDCDGRTTFSGCPVFPYAAFGVTVAQNQATSGCETTSVAKDADYFNAGAEAITTFEQAFAGASGNGNPGTSNLGREEGQRRADERRAREDRDDQPPVVALSACSVGGGGGGPSLPSGGPPTLYPGAGSVVEGNAGTTVLNVPVFLFPTSASTVTVNYTADGVGSTATPGVDFVPQTGTLTFPPGSMTQNVPITINGDVAIESDETIVVSFSGPVGAPLAYPNGFGQIDDDDGPIQIEVDNTATFEGNAGTTNLVFDVRLSRESAAPVTVTYQTIPGGTASVGADYTSVPPTVLNIPANTIGATFSVPVTTDLVAEPTETVLVQLSAPSAGTDITNQTATGTILDDDGPPTIAVLGGAAIEGCDSTNDLDFTVLLSQPLGSAVTVNFTTSNGTATAGADYEAASGTVTFAPGTTSQTVSVQIVGDELAEADETVFVNLSGAAGAAIVVPEAAGTILDDD